MKKILEVKNITKIYKSYTNNLDRLKEIFSKRKYHKEFYANKNISFELFEKETLGIIGVNGAGKSTILKIIVGVVSPTLGEIIKKGRVTALLELGTGFNNELSGLENIFLNGTLIGMSQKECEERKDEIIKFSELGEYIYEPIKNYSSGMKMRLAFSIAIHSQPQILIVDEALSVGDAHFQSKCTKALKKRKEEDMSIIYVSHDLNSLKLLCDRVVLLNKGEVVQVGTPQDVINQYNFLIAKLNDEDDSLKMDSQCERSFGSFDVKIEKIDLKKDNSSIKSVVTGDMVDIDIDISSNIDIENITIGIHIRDKYSQDIYGTNTHYQKKTISLKKGKIYTCTFSMQLNIGEGKYTIGAALHTSDWHTNDCYHWIDDDFSFQVLGDINNFSIGLCKLYPNITYKEKIDELVN